MPGISWCCSRQAISVLGVSTVLYICTLQHIQLCMYMYIYYTQALMFTYTQNSLSYLIWVYYPILYIDAQLILLLKTWLMYNIYLFCRIIDNLVLWIISLQTPSGYGAPKPPGTLRMPETPICSTWKRRWFLYNKNKVIFV